MFLYRKKKYHICVKKIDFLNWLYNIKNKIIFNSCLKLIFNFMLIKIFLFYLRHPRHKKYIKEICEEMQEVRKEKQRPVLILYSLIDNQYMTLL